LKAGAKRGQEQQLVSEKPGEEFLGSSR